MYVLAQMDCSVWFVVLVLVLVVILWKICIGNQGWVIGEWQLNVKELDEADSI